MQPISYKIRIVFFRLVGLLILYQITRLLFYLFNYSFFSSSSSTDIFSAFIWGMRFDAWIILIFNLPVIIISMLPLSRTFEKIGKYYFVIINSVVLLFNLIDIEYFKFTLKRSTADLFSLIGTGKDVWIMLPRFIIDFWYIVVFFIALIIILWYLVDYFKPKQTTSFHHSIKNWLFLIGIWILVSGSIFVVLRGTKLRPVNLLSASLHANSNEVPLVLNTPFSIIKTFGKEAFTAHHYFNGKNELPFSSVYVIPSNKEQRNCNVVILILESFSKEHIGFFSPQNKGFTPFLDSLLGQSLVVKYSYANGRKSLESLPSILSSIPSLMETPYILSTFGSNNIRALPAVLAEHGYNTSFYHGGTNGTMGFDVFSAISGIKNYYGRWQYPNASDYDGDWGIWDEPYLQYVKKQYDTKKEPFFSVIYTLSSHHPYKVPKSYQKLLPEGKIKLLQSIAYTDVALRKFFNAAKQSSWFKNTLFVITADHVFGAQNDYYYNRSGCYAVPIAFYQYNNSSLKGVLNQTMQHADIFPSVLQYLGIRDTIVGFGKSVWDTATTHYAVNYINGEYQLMSSSHLLIFNGAQTTGFYDIATDSLLHNNLMGKGLKSQTEMEIFLKSIIQEYDDAITKNKLTLSNIKLWKNITH
jgi:phosphoglycerol transferase MdoB-like AlkP superfamily enzyme